MSNPASEAIMPAKKLMVTVKKSNITSDLHEGTEPLKLQVGG